MEGLRLVDEGFGGKGLTQEAIERARNLARGGTISLLQRGAGGRVVKSSAQFMNAWFSRHKVDRRPGWKAQRTPGYVPTLGRSITRSFNKPDRYIRGFVRKWVWSQSGKSLNLMFFYELSDRNPPVPWDEALLFLRGLSTPEFMTPRTVERYGIGYTDDGSSAGKILRWKQKDGQDLSWSSLEEALEACDHDGWAGYVFSYPDGYRPIYGWEE